MSSKSLLDAVLSDIAFLAPSGYYIGLHIRFTSPLITMNTYPPEWVRQYTQSGFALRDPVVAWGFGDAGPSRWSEITIPDTFGIMAQAATHGLKYGVVVPAGELNSRTIGSVARSDREFSDVEIELISHHIKHLHELTQPPRRLTRSQSEALRLVAEGDRYNVAAKKLGISESALKARLSTARDRLSARTTAEAVQRAIDYGLL